MKASSWLKMQRLKVGSLQVRGCDCAIVLFVHDKEGRCDEIFFPNTFKVLELKDIFPNIKIEL